MTRWVAGILAALVAAAAVIVGWSYARGRRATHLRPGEAVPDVELATAVGEGRARLRDNLGRAATVVVFLDTRWPVMARYAPMLERLNRRYNRRGFTMVGICLDDSKDAASEFAVRNALTFTVLHDPGGRATRAGFGEVRGPESYLLDRSGRVVQSFVDPVDWLREDRRAPIEALLPSPPPGWF